MPDPPMSTPNPDVLAIRFLFLIARRKAAGRI
jgi:hypothetical protein